MGFLDKLDGAIAQYQSLLVVELSPDPDWLNETWRKISVVEWIAQSEAIAPILQTRLQTLIEQTADLVCAYTLNLEAYRSLGGPGLRLLQTVLAAIPSKIPIILDAKHGDRHTSALLAEMAFEHWQVDAITLLPYAGQDQVAPFLVDPNKAVIVLAATGNPSAPVLQHYPDPDTPFYLQLVMEAKTWGTPNQVAFEVETSDLKVLQRIRAIAPERILWLSDRWNEADLDRILSVGLSQHGDGLILSVPSEYWAQTEPVSAIRTLRDQVNRLRIQKAAGSPACAVWMPDVCLLQNHPYQDLILQLYDIGCLRFGEFVQASGATFPYYIDLRTIISNPQVFDAVLSAYSAVLKGLKFDRIAGIPYGSLPTATGLSLRLNSPMIFPRKEVKAHGAKRLVEGHFHPGETAVLVDDILISGKSALEGAAKLESVGLQVNDIVVFIDHEKGVKDRIRHQGYEPYAVLTLSEIADTLCRAGKISDRQRELLLANHD